MKMEYTAATATQQLRATSDINIQSVSKENVLVCDSRRTVVVQTKSKQNIFPTGISCNKEIK